MSQHSAQNLPHKGLGTYTYCSQVQKLTSDHVFPKSLFLKLDSSMLTVPACEDCQRLKGYGDADLEVFANLHIMGSTHPDSIAHIEKVAGRNEGTERFLRHLVDTAEIRSIVTPSGTQISEALLANYNSSRIITSMTMAVRGLYYNSTGNVLESDVDCLAEIVPWNAFYPLIKKLAPYGKAQPEVKGNNVVWWCELHIELSSPEDSLYLACVNDKILFLLATGGTATQIRSRLKLIEKSKNRDVAILKYEPRNITLYQDQIPKQ